MTIHKYLFLAIFAQRPEKVQLELQQLEIILRIRTATLSLGQVME